MIFKADVLELSNANGDWCGYRVEWTEARTLVESVLAWFAKGFLTYGVVAGIVAVVAGLVAGANGFMLVAMAAVALLGLGWALVRASVHMPGKPNAIELYEDGRIWSSWQGDWKTHMEDIRNVESEQLKQKKTDEDCPYTHGVRIITRRGRTFRVAVNIEPDDAIMLAVLLSESIEAIRFPQVTATINGKEIAVW
jgi:hypothetical protein